MTLNWLFGYNTEHVLAGRWGLRKETIRKKVRGLTKKIAKLKSKKIRLDFGDFDDDEIYIFSVDGVHFTKHEVRTKPGPEWYGTKSNSAGLAYEVAVAIQSSSKIVWTNGLHPTSKHDMTIFCGGTTKEKKSNWEKNSLYFKISEGREQLGTLDMLASQKNYSCLIDCYYYCYCLIDWLIVECVDIIVSFLLIVMYYFSNMICISCHSKCFSSITELLIVACFCCGIFYFDLCCLWFSACSFPPLDWLLSYTCPITPF